MIWVPFGNSFGANFLQQVLKVASKVGSRRALERSHKKRRNSETLEPSGLCWRLHKTTIFTMSPCLPKGSKMPPQITRFCHFGLQNGAMAHIWDTFWRECFSVDFLDMKQSPKCAEKGRGPSPILVPVLPLSDSPPLVLPLKGTPKTHLQLPDEQALSGIY